MERYEKDLTQYALERFENAGFLHEDSRIRLVGSKNPENRLGVFSFVFKDRHPHDIAEILADSGICVRSGHHCTDPLHTAL